MISKEVPFWKMGLALSALLLFSFAACAEHGSEAYRDDDTAAVGEEMRDEAGITLGDIADDPERYSGQTVTLMGEVGDIHSPQAFELKEEGIGFGDELLVLTREQGTVSEDSHVQVTGTIKMLTVVELERELGWDLTPEIEAEIESRRAVLVATRVSPSTHTPRG